MGVKWEGILGGWMFVWTTDGCDQLTTAALVFKFFVAHQSNE